MLTRIHADARNSLSLRPRCYVSERPIGGKRGAKRNTLPSLRVSNAARVRNLRIAKRMLPTNTSEIVASLCVELLGVGVESTANGDEQLL